MKNYYTEQVLDVHHWTEKLFSFKTSKPDSFNFKNGEFVMIGLSIHDKQIFRAYSIASPNYENYLEFFSIKVPDGKFTQHLQNINIGDEILINKKTTGSLINDNLLPKENLYLLSTGTGLAPFMSVIQDIDVLDNYKKIILMHGVRYKNDLAYSDDLSINLHQKEYIGELLKEKLTYIPIVSREDYTNHGRITHLIQNNDFLIKYHLNELSQNTDNVMICGNQDMLKDLVYILEGKGFKESKQGYQGDYVIERAFVQ